jgi:hypothetical protein
MIGNYKRAQKIVYNQLAVKLHLIPKLSADPVGVYFIGFAVYTHIKRADVSVIAELGDDLQDGYWSIIKGIAGDNLAHKRSSFQNKTNGFPSGKLTIIKTTNKCLWRHCTKQMNCGTRLNEIFNSTWQELILCL